MHLESFLDVFCNVNCIFLFEQKDSYFVILSLTPPSMSDVRHNISSCAQEGVQRQGAFGQ